MKELLELKDEILKIFQTDIEHLGDTVMETVMSADEGKYDAYLETVDGDMYTDYMQMIFQYYLADRKDKKQDYTPKSIAEFMGALIGSSDKVVDMCAGSGALTIQKWILNPNQQFDLYELDERVIPFLLFNLAFIAEMEKDE